MTSDSWQITDHRLHKGDGQFEAKLINKKNNVYATIYLFKNAGVLFFYRLI